MIQCVYSCFDFRIPSNVVSPYSSQCIVVFRWKLECKQLLLSFTFSFFIVYIQFSLSLLLRLTLSSPSAFSSAVVFSSSFLINLCWRQHFHWKNDCKQTIFSLLLIFLVVAVVFCLSLNCDNYHLCALGWSTENGTYNNSCNINTLVLVYNTQPSKSNAIHEQKESNEEWKERAGEACDCACIQNPLREKEFQTSGLNL